MSTKARMKLETGPASGDQHALPARMGAEFAGIAGAFRTRRFAGHFYVSAQRQSTHAIVGVAPLHAKQARAKAEGKNLDADATELGNGEVAELVHQHHDAEHEKERNGRDNGKRHIDIVRTRANFGSIPEKSGTQRRCEAPRPAKTSRASSRA